MTTFTAHNKKPAEATIPDKIRSYNRAQKVERPVLAVFER